MGGAPSVGKERYGSDEWLDGAVRRLAFGFSGPPCCSSSLSGSLESRAPLPSWAKWTSRLRMRWLGWSCTAQRYQPFGLRKEHNCCGSYDYDLIWLDRRYESIWEIGLEGRSPFGFCIVKAKSSHIGLLKHSLSQTCSRYVLIHEFQLLLKVSSTRSVCRPLASCWGDSHRCPGHDAWLAWHNLRDLCKHLYFTCFSMFFLQDELYLQHQRSFFQTFSHPQ